ncbi:hypothetical protein ACHQM5_022167 [Ranunculus cassubicifolius]
MQKFGVKPNESVLVSVLSHCLWVHSYMKRHYMFGCNTILGTAITDMIAKCGSSEAALLTFGGIKDKNVGAWNVMICGVAMNGDAV